MLLKNIQILNKLLELILFKFLLDSPSPTEAALIANTYADQYNKLNLEMNRKQLSSIKDFLEKQASEKLEELNLAEDSLKIFKQKGGIVKLDEQSTELIISISQV